LELDETYQQINTRFEDLIFNGGILNKAALGILCCLCLFLLFFALNKKLKRQWNSTFFVLLCAAVFLWSWSTLIAEFIQPGSDVAALLHDLSLIGILLIPALLCVHTKRQVSYKEMHLVPTLILFVPSAFFLLVILKELLVPGSLLFIPDLSGALWIEPAFYVYAAVVLIRAYLLCFNVFYQMPRHMRSSTGFVLLSITAFVLLLVFNVLYNSSIYEIIPHNRVMEILPPTAATLSFFFLIYPLYSAMRLMPAEDVIVTSRDFVMGGLSTTILVLGRRKQILDWNRKDWGKDYPLPKPLYREPLDVYRRRIAEQNPSRVSKYDNNIITIVQDGGEMHFLMKTREVQGEKRRFGYVLEISEITQVYTMLRLFEEIAHFDQLTKLNNRNAYLDYVQTVISEENMPLLVFVGDVNGLKQLNDNYGHIVGDRLLVLIADIISEAAPEGAFIARIGGDEYVMLVPNGNKEIADEFVKNVINLCSLAEMEIIGTPSISWGYAIMDSVEQSYNEIFENADAMMYMYKKGRNQFTSSGIVPD